MSHPSDKKYTDLAREKYNLPEELALQKEWAQHGFYMCESRMVQAHFSTVEDVLVIGCGAGREAFAFLKEGIQVTAVDLNEGLLRAARELSPDGKLPVTVQNAVQLGIRSNAMPGASMLAQILSMIPGRDNRQQALREIFRVLQPGGLFLLSSHNWKFGFKYRLYFRVMNPLRKLLKALGLPCLEPGDHIGKNVSEEKRSPHPYFRHFYIMDELLGELRDAGFEIVDCRSREELNRDVSEPAIRENDYYLYYVARKPA